MIFCYKKYVFYFFAFVAILGCGGVGTKTTPYIAPVATPVTPTVEQNQTLVKASLIEVGIFMDSEVGGLSISCGNKTSKTNAKGEFDYIKSDACMIKLGDNEFFIDMNVVEDGIVTPFTMTTSDEEAYELSRVIQSLSSQNEDGTLWVDDKKADKLVKIDLTDNIASAKAIEATGAIVITLDEAKKHLSKNFDLEVKDKKQSLKSDVKEELKARILIQKTKKQEKAITEQINQDTQEQLQPEPESTSATQEQLQSNPESNPATGADASSSLTTSVTITTGSDSNSSNPTTLTNVSVVVRNGNK